jgi:hypothetical protein
MDNMEDHEMEAIVAAIVGAFIGSVAGFGLVYWLYF